MFYVDPTGSVLVKDVWPPPPPNLCKNKYTLPCMPHINDYARPVRKRVCATIALGSGSV